MATGKLIIFSAPWLRQINHYQLSVDTKPEPVFLLFLPPAALLAEKNGMVWNISSYLLRNSDNALPIMSFWNTKKYTENRFYGTLKAQVEKQLEAGQNVIFDVDVVGGCNIKKYYGSRALSVFIQPPSVEELRKRLQGRGTDAPEVIESRIAKAEFELGFADKFDTVIVNDDFGEGKGGSTESY